MRVRPRVAIGSDGQCLEGRSRLDGWAPTSGRPATAAGLIALVCALALAVSPAEADFVPVGQFGSEGSGDGQFSNPHDVAVHQSSNRVFVVDRGNDRVQVFQDDGSGDPVADSVDFVAAFGDSGAGALVDPVGIAVNQTTGDVYVTDAGRGEIVRFDSSLAFVSAFGSVGSGGGNGEFVSLAVGIAVDPTTGDLLVPDMGGRVQRLDASGAFVSSFDGSDGNPDGAFAGTTNPDDTAAAPRDVAVDGSGSVWVMQTTGGGVSGAREIYKFDAAGAYLLQLDSPYSASSLDDVIAVEPTSGDVFFTDFTFFPGFSIWQATAAGAPVQQFAMASAFGADPQRRGLAVNPALERVYVSEAGLHHVAVLGPPAPPDVVADPASDLRQASARLSGTVNPNGAGTTYRFEYGTDSSYGSSVPVPDGDLGAGTDALEVSAQLDGLTPGTTYHFRLVATNASGTTEGPDMTFDTLPALAPDVTTGTASDVTDAVATLRGTVDPRGAATAYRFEWGTDTSYGNSVPVPDGDAGSGVAPVDVAEDLVDLAPETTYHYRLVATSSAGVATGEDATFTTPASAPSADQRGYELATPADDANFDFDAPAKDSLITYGAASARVSSEDGRHAVARFGLAGGLLPGMGLDGEISDFAILSRGDTGWDWVVPVGDRSSVGGCNLENGNLGFDTLGDDGRLQLVRTQCLAERPALSGGLDLTTAFNGKSLYAFDGLTNAATFIGAAVDDQGAPVPRHGRNDDVFVGGSPDLSTVYFASYVRLDGRVPVLPHASTQDRYLYRRDGDGLTVAARTVDGFAVSIPTTIDPQPLDRPGAVSSDGTAATLTAPSEAAMVPGDTNAVSDVYQVRDGAVTWASQSSRTPADTPADRLFEGASEDGSRIFFSTTERMTDDDEDARKDVYVFDLGAGLSRVSAGPMNDNADGSDDVADLATVAADGSHAFFVSGSRLLTADADGGRSLYVRDVVAGATHYVAPATSAADGDRGTFGSLVAGSPIDAQTGAFMTRPIKVSHDGEQALFALASDVALPAGRGGVDTDGVQDLYAWSQGGGLRRVRQGAEVNDNEITVPSLACSGLSQTPVYEAPCRGIADDGGLAFFETTDSLTDLDTDGGQVDVYGVDPADGSIELLSPPGDAPVESIYIDNSASGHHVFFLTRETLDPSRDRDGNDELGRVDLYVARDGEVFPPLPDPEPPCAGDGCQPPPAVPPGRPPLGSDGAGSSDNADPGARARVSIDRPGQRARRRAARTGVLRLRVRAATEGTLTAIARARVRSGSGMRTRVVARERVRVGSAGEVTLRLRLSGRATGQLRARGVLRLTVKVVMPGARQRSQAVVLRLPKEDR